jgi:hypothetical protein
MVMAACCKTKPGKIQAIAACATAAQTHNAPGMIVLPLNSPAMLQLACHNTRAVLHPLHRHRCHSNSSHVWRPLAGW